jgi:hypothetical protein
MGEHVQRHATHRTAKPAKPATAPRPPAPRTAYEQVIHLQRTAGNTAVSRLIQRKLTVGAANDPLEREADRVADRVVSGATNTAQTAQAGGQDVRRNAAEEDELMTKRVDISRAPQEEDELMTKRDGMLGAFDASPAFERQLRSAGGGNPLDKNTRSEMERGIGADFSGVRVHTGAQASSLNRSISAQAFTRGSDVFFSSGKYNPGSAGGKRLLAHELTHVVQQGGAVVGNTAQRNTLSHPSERNAVIQRQLSQKQTTEWQSKIKQKRQEVEQLIKNRPEKDPAEKEMVRLLESSEDVAGALMHSPKAENNDFANINQLFAGLSGLAVLGRGGGYVKSGAYEKQIESQGKSATRYSYAAGLFQHRETSLNGMGLAKFDQGEYAKRALSHTAGALMNLALPVSLLGLMGGSAMVKLRALSTRSTERTLEHEGNKQYKEPLENYRKGITNIITSAGGPEGIDISDVIQSRGGFDKVSDAVNASSQIALKNLDTLLKKRKAQHENVSRSGTKGTEAEELSSNWLTGNLLKSMALVPFYGRNGNQRLKRFKKWWKNSRQKKR